MKSCLLPAMGGEDSLLTGTGLSYIIIVICKISRQADRQEGYI